MSNRTRDDLKELALDAGIYYRALIEEQLSVELAESLVEAAFAFVEVESSDGIGHSTHKLS